MQRRIAAESIGTLPATARAAMRELLIRGPLPRAELARLLDLSPASLTKATRSLLSRGLIATDAASGEEVRGRPGVPLSIVADRTQFLGIKVTADAVFAIRADAVGGVHDSRRRDLATTEVPTVVAQIVDLVKEMTAHQSVEAIGIGLAGQMSRFDDHARRNPYLRWDEVPLAQLIEDAAGIPTVISCDVRALTAGVQWWGPGHQWQDFAVMTIGVGIGFCPVIGGKVLAGPRGAVGMVGHQRINEAGPMCRKGHRGCAAAMLPSGAITKTVSAAHGRPLDLHEVVALADDGDPVAERALREAGQALGVLIAEAVNMLDLEAVVITGDGLPILRHSRQAMEAAIADRIDRRAYSPHIEILDSDFDEWARGAAVVACQWLLLDPPAPVRLGLTDLPRPRVAS